MSNQKEKRLTWAELIAELQKFPPDEPAEVAVRTWTQSYPVGYLSPTTYSRRIYVSFPEGYSVHKKKGAREL